MKNKEQAPKSAKIIKFNENFKKDDDKTSNCEQNLSTDESWKNDYIILGETQKFKYALNYVIKLLKAKMISVDDAINLLMSFI